MYFTSSEYCMWLEVIEIRVPHKPGQSKRVCVCVWGGLKKGLADCGEDKRPLLVLGDGVGGGGGKGGGTDPEGEGGRRWRGADREMVGDLSHY